MNSLKKLENFRWILITLVVILIVTIIISINTPALNNIKAYYEEISQLREQKDGWAVHKNEFDNYELSYPSGLNIYPANSEKSVTYITNYDLEKYSFKESQNFKLEAAVVPNNNKLELSRWVEENNRLAQEANTIYRYVVPSESFEVNISNNRGIYEGRTDELLGGVKTWYFILNEEEILILNFQVNESYEQIVAEILNSLKINDYE
jgi:hypothetical protein